jgi:hypothetical protein
MPDNRQCSEHEHSEEAPGADTQDDGSQTEETRWVRALMPISPFLSPKLAVQNSVNVVISGFGHGVNTALATLGCYAAQIESYRRFETTYLVPIFNGQVIEENFLTLEDGTHMLYRNVGEYQSRVCKIFERRGFQPSHRSVYVSTQEINTHFMCLTLRYKMVHRLWCSLHQLLKSLAPISYWLIPPVCSASHQPRILFYIYFARLLKTAGWCKRNAD